MMTPLLLMQHEANRRGGTMTPSVAECPSAGLMAAHAAAAKASSCCCQGSRSGVTLKQMLLTATILALLFFALEPADRQATNAHRLQPQLLQSSIISPVFSAAGASAAVVTAAVASAAVASAAAAAVPGAAAKRGQAFEPEEEEQQEQDSLEMEICEGRVLFSPHAQQHPSDRDADAAAAAGAQIDFSEVQVALVTEDGTIKETEHCSPTGHFLLALDALPGGGAAPGGDERHRAPLRRRRPVELRVSGPEGWLFEPQAHRLQDGRCESHEEILFFFKGFGIGGRVQAGSSSSNVDVSGLRVRLRRLSDGAVSVKETAAALARRRQRVCVCGETETGSIGGEAEAAAGAEKEDREESATTAATAGAESMRSRTCCRQEEESFTTVVTGEDGSYLFSGVRPGLLELQVFYVTAAPFAAVGVSSEEETTSTEEVAFKASDLLLLRLTPSGKVWLLQQPQHKPEAAAAAGAGQAAAAATAEKTQHQRETAAAGAGDKRERAAEIEEETVVSHYEEQEAEHNVVLLPLTYFAVVGRFEDTAGKPLSAAVMVGLYPLDASCPVVSSDSFLSFEEALADALTLQSHPSSSSTSSRCTYTGRDPLSSAAAASSSVGLCSEKYTSDWLSVSAEVASREAAAEAFAATHLFASQQQSPLLLQQRAKFAVAAPAAAGWFLFTAVSACKYRLIPASRLLLPQKQIQEEEKKKQQLQQQQQMQQHSPQHVVYFHPEERDIEAEAFILSLQHQQKQQQLRGVFDAGTFQLQGFAVTGCVGIATTATEAAAAAEAGAAGAAGESVNICDSTIEGVAGARIVIRRAPPSSSATAAADGDGELTQHQQQQQILGEGLTDAEGYYSIKISQSHAAGPVQITAIKQHYQFNSLRLEEISLEKSSLPPLLVTGVEVCGRVEEAAKAGEGGEESRAVDVYVHRMSPSSRTKGASSHEQQTFHVKQGDRFCFLATPHSVYSVAAAFTAGRQQQQVTIAATPLLDLLLSETRYKLIGKVTCSSPPPSQITAAAAAAAIHAAAAGGGGGGNAAAAAAAGNTAAAPAAGNTVTAVAAAAGLCSPARLALRISRILSAEETEEEGDDVGDKEVAAAAAAATAEAAGAAEEKAEDRRSNNENNKRRRRLSQVWIERDIFKRGDNSNNHKEEESSAATTNPPAKTTTFFFSIDELPAGEYKFSIVEKQQIEDVITAGINSSTCNAFLCWKQQTIEVILPPPESESDERRGVAAAGASAAAAVDAPVAAAFLHFEQTGYNLCGEANTSLVASFPLVSSSSSVAAAASSSMTQKHRKFMFLSQGEFTVCLSDAAPAAYELVASSCLRLHTDPPSPFSLPLLAAPSAAVAAAPPAAAVGEAVIPGKMRVHVLQRRVQAEVVLLLQQQHLSEGKRRKQQFTSELQELLFGLRVLPSTAAAAEHQQQQQQDIEEEKQKTQIANTPQQQQQQQQDVSENVRCTFLRVISLPNNAGKYASPAAASSAAAAKAKNMKEKQEEKADMSESQSVLYSCLFWLPIEEEEGDAAAAAQEDIIVELLLPSSHPNFFLQQPFIRLSPAAAAALPRLTGTTTAASAASPTAAAAASQLTPAVVRFGMECGVEDAPVVARFVVEQQCVIEGAVSPPLKGVLFRFQQAETGETLSPSVHSRSDGSFSSAAIRCRNYYHQAIALSPAAATTAAATTVAATAAATLSSSDTPSLREKQQQRDQAAELASAAAAASHQKTQSPASSSSSSTSFSSPHYQLLSDREALVELLRHTIVSASLPGYIIKQTPLNLLLSQEANAPAAANDKEKKEKQQQQQPSPPRLLFTATK